MTNSKIFSLEIFIDRLRLAAGEKCLFPTTILKLLNYEPALISSIDNSVQDNLREYIDPVLNLGKVIQIEQLKDADGNYAIRQGKSILFEADTVCLMNELNVLPVYILITDDYYNPSHLVGVVAINLSSVMHRLAQKMSHRSCTVSEDTGGRFPLVNLMGDGVGALTLKLRLIYVGDSIGCHVIPEHELEVRKMRDAGCNDVVDKSVGDREPHLDGRVHTSAPSTVIVRNIGCQADGNRSIRIQVNTNFETGPNRAARIGLSIDPNDPLLEGPPPMIYNSCYANNDCDEFSCHGNEDGTDRFTNRDISPKEPTQAPTKKISKKPSQNLKTPLLQNTVKKAPKAMPILDALFSELKTWQSDNFVEQPSINTARPTCNRSKSAEVRPPLDRSPTDFLRRISQPKVRAASPVGVVPKHLGWLRSEPQYTGPTKSSLEYKLTKTQLRRLELRNPRLFQQHQLATIPTQRRISDTSAATTYTEPPPKQRHPLVPPLFNAGTSISVPTFTPSESSTLTQPKHRRDNDTDEKSQRLPPRSPERQRNNNSNNHPTMSHETDGTLDEADHFLNLNPVQSNRSPQMTIRSQATMMERDGDTDDAGTEEEDDDSHDDRLHYADNNRSDEYSDELGASFSSTNGPVSVSRRHSNESQVSQSQLNSMKQQIDYSTDYRSHCASMKPIGNSKTNSQQLFVMNTISSTTKGL